MRRFVLDTNVVLAALKDHPLWQRLQAEHKLGADDALVMISTVTMGELLSLAEQNGWESQKKEKLEKLLRRYVIIDINHTDDALMTSYARIDAFSQGRLSGHTLGLTSRNMGKNDLWIAATAAVTKAKLEPISKLPFGLRRGLIAPSLRCSTLTELPAMRGFRALAGSRNPSGSLPKAILR